MNPRYQGIIKEQIPRIERKDSIIKIIAGELDGVSGPVTNLVVDVDYFDITLHQRKVFTRITEKDYKTFVYVIKGSGFLNDIQINSQQCAVLNEGDLVTMHANNTLHFLLISGRPIGESIAWGGPIVMNTEVELEQAFRELDNGTFIKNRTPRNTVRKYYIA